MGLLLSEGEGGEGNERKGKGKGRDGPLARPFLEASADYGHLKL